MLHFQRPKLCIAVRQEAQSEAWFLLGSGHNQDHANAPTQRAPQEALRG
jgi:hypothetical protein